MREAHKRAQIKQEEENKLKQAEKKLELSETQKILKLQMESKQA